MTLPKLLTRVTVVRCDVSRYRLFYRFYFDDVDYRAIIFVIRTSVSCQSVMNTQ